MKAIYIQQHGSVDSLKVSQILVPSIRPDEGADILNELAPLFESGALKPPSVGEQYPPSEAAQSTAAWPPARAERSFLVMPSNSQDLAGVASEYRTSSD